MSRITKWKFEKTKVKVVFRLQFHATHIPQSGWDKLFISFIPSDSGKPTAKTTKANVRNGTCKWGDPIYETTRLLQDTKTKRYDEKLYKLVMAMGSSRASVLGEATINLADYADALKPLVVALPLHGCDFGTVLHVTVQLLTSKTGFREFEQQREIRERGLQTDESSGAKLLSFEETSNDQMVNTRVRFKQKSKDVTSLEEEAGLNEDYADSGVGFDGSSNTSGSLYAEKHDSLSTNEVDSLKSTVSGDLAGLSLAQSPQIEKGDPSDHRFSAQGGSDWVHGWSSDYSAENDLAATHEENSKLRGSLEVAESSILELKMEVSSLQTHAEEIGYEAQKFAKQLAAEVASGEELAKEVSFLKSECSTLKDDLQRLKFCKLCPPLGSGEAAEAERSRMFQDLQLIWLKGIISVEDKIRELQNKARFGFHERDFRVLQADLETLLGTLENLKLGSGLTISGLNILPSEEENLKETGGVNLHKNGQFVAGTELDVDSYQPELGMLHCLSIPGLVSHEHETVDATNAMKGKIFELLRELDESKAEQESLIKKMGEMECYYEALVQELEENQRRMLGELQNLRSEHATCLYTVSSTKSEMEMLHQELNVQILRLSEDKKSLESLNKELERRAMTAEAALKRARLNYSIAVGQLQKDLELLSSQVSSMFETNENIIRQAFVDSSQVGSRRLGSGESHEVEILCFENQNGEIKKQQLGVDILSEDLKRSLCMQEGLYLKLEGEVSEMHFMNLYQNVLSNILQETLLEASDDFKLMKEKLNELVWQLELSTEAKELLIQKLQSAADDVQALNEYKATCMAKCNDLAQENQILETNLQNVTNENHLFVQKIVELESLVNHYMAYESKYEACAAERTDLSCLLENKILEIDNLRNEIVTLQEELKTVKGELNELASREENLQNLVNFLENKLQNLLMSYERSIFDLPPLRESVNLDSESGDLKSVVDQLEEFQHNACNKILQLLEERKFLMHERDSAETSITAAESEIVLTKRRCQSDIQNMVSKLDVSYVLVEKLQLGVEAIANRFKVSSEIEERNSQLHTEFFSVLDHLDVELQELISKSRDLAHEFLALETVTDELGRSKLITVELAKKNQHLMASLQNKTEESSRLASEVETLKESLRHLHDENQALLASSKDKTEESVMLASELNSLKDRLQSLHAENQALMASSQGKAEEAAKLASEVISLKESLGFLRDDNQALMISSQRKMEECARLTTELNNSKESLRSLHDANQALMVSSRDKVEESTNLLSQINSLRENLQSMQDEKRALMVSSQDKTDEAAKFALELSNLKEDLESLRSENQALKVSSQCETEKAAQLACEINNLRESLHSLQDEKQTLMVASLDKTEEAAKLASESRNLKEHLESLHAENQVMKVSSQNEMEKASQLVLELDSVRESFHHLQDEKQALMVSSRDKTEEAAKSLLELNNLKKHLESLYDENQRLKVFSEDEAEKAAQLARELDSMKERFQSLHDELHDERSLKGRLESTIKDLTSQLDEKQGQLLQFDQHETELVHLKQRVSDLELEKSRLDQLLLHSEECLKSAREGCSYISTLETLLSETTEMLVASDVRFFFTEAHCRSRVEELVQQLHVLHFQLSELQKRHADAEANLNQCLSSEALHVEENVMLLTNLNSSRSELEAVVAENRLLYETNRAIRAELEGCKDRAHILQNESQHSIKVQRLEQKLASTEEEIDNIMSTKEELEIKALVLSAKLYEQQSQIDLLAGDNNELVMLRKQCNELTQKLSEQIMRTEEFRNLSVHLKELKEKVDAERAQSRERKEADVPPAAMQESLRIAFIKEQYEGRLQELKQQLSMSKKHSEEMLLKLQDAIDEIENRKKLEVSHLKKNEELGMRILELEEELQSALAEKREKTSSYDLMKAEMECSLISLDCCKEEKQKLEVSLLECEEEKSKIEVELILLKEKLGNSKSIMNIQGEENDESCKVDNMSSDGPAFINAHEKSSNGEKSKDTYLKRETLMSHEEAELACPMSDDEVDHSTPVTYLPPEQDVLVSAGVNGLQSSTFTRQDSLLDTDRKQLALINEHFKAESLRSSMDHLSNELERMKNDNSVFLQDDNDLHQKFPCLQSELVQLQKADEELQSMFPSYNEFSGKGNALERVLALEIELAEALQRKKRSSIHFQSSFLKQHSDEEAIFKSFRDINDLIKDMLEMKGRYATIEAELKEMHDRYSQLSLQFAEVEGERQKLMMTIKNIRSSKKALHLNRSSSATLGDHSPP